MRRHKLLFSVVMGSAGFVGCWRLDMSHCTNKGGECPELHFCSSCELGNNGCVAEQPSEDCRFIGDDGAGGVDGSGRLDESSSTALTSDSDDDGKATTGAVSTGSGSEGTTAGARCDGDVDCDAARPGCVAGLCVPCNMAENPDAACEAADSGRPLCGTIGTCVPCREGKGGIELGSCEGATPLCDVSTSSCVGCTGHEQCPALAPVPYGACNSETGACFDASQMVHVDGDGGEGIDFTTIGAAIASVGDAATIVIHERDDDLSYQEEVVIGAGRTVALMAALEEVPTWGSPGVSSALVVEQGAQVFVDRLRFRGGTTSMHHAISVRGDGTVLWLDRADVTENNGGGLEVVDSARAVVRSSFIAGIGNVAPAVTLVDGSLVAVYTTLVRSFNPGSPVLSCSGASSVSLRNSFVVNEESGSGQELDCSAPAISTSVVRSTSDASGWFQDFAGGNLSLDMPPAEVFTSARWLAGDPPADINGDARPREAGAVDVVGADRTGS